MIKCKCGGRLRSTNYMGFNQPNFRCKKCGKEHRINMKYPIRVAKKEKKLTPKEFVEANS